MWLDVFPHPMYHLKIPFGIKKSQERALARRSFDVPQQQPGGRGRALPP
jgi:hypothetical protein